MNDNTNYNNNMHDTLTNLNVYQLYERYPNQFECIYELKTNPNVE